VILAQERLWFHKEIYLVVDSKIFSAFVLLINKLIHGKVVDNTEMTQRKKANKKWDHRFYFLKKEGQTRIQLKFWWILKYFCVIWTCFDFYFLTQIYWRKIKHSMLLNEMTFKFWITKGKRISSLPASYSLPSPHWSWFFFTHLLIDIKTIFFCWKSLVLKMK